MVRGIAFSSSYAAGRGTMFRFTQFVLVAHTRTSRDTTIQYCPEDSLLEYCSLELAERVWSILQLESLHIIEAALGCAYATGDVDE